MPHCENKSQEYNGHHGQPNPLHPGPAHPAQKAAAPAVQAFATEMAEQRILFINRILAVRTDQIRHAAYNIINLKKE
jgi:hypothetical protein